MKWIEVKEKLDKMSEPQLPNGERKAYDGQMELYDTQKDWWLKAKKIESNP